MEAPIITSRLALMDMQAKIASQYGGISAVKDSVHYRIIQALLNGKSHVIVAAVPQGVPHIYKYITEELGKYLSDVRVFRYFDKISLSRISRLCLKPGTIVLVDLELLDSNQPINVEFDSNTVLSNYADLSGITRSRLKTAFALTANQCKF